MKKLLKPALVMLLFVATLFLYDLLVYQSLSALPAEVEAARQLMSLLMAWSILIIIIMMFLDVVSIPVPKKFQQPFFVMLGLVIVFFMHQGLPPEAELEGQCLYWVVGVPISLMTLLELLVVLTTPPPRSYAEAFLQIALLILPLFVIAFFVPQGLPTEPELELARTLVKVEAMLLVYLICVCTLVRWWLQRFGIWRQQ